MSNKTKTNNWDTLSIRQKASLMKEYIKNGVRNLDQIKEHYNKLSEVKQDATYMAPELKRIPKPRYTPFIGEIKADDRSKLEKAFDNLATKYNTSNFANSAVAEVLSATTPYGLVHEGLGGNKDAAVLSIAPFGATLKNEVNYIKSLYKGVRGALDTKDAKIFEALNPKNGITYTNKAETIPGMSYEHAARIALNPSLSRVWNLEQGLNSPIPKRYIDRLGSLNEVYAYPRITQKYPYKRKGKYLESSFTHPIFTIRMNLLDPNQGKNLKSWEDLNKVTQKAYDEAYKILQYLGKGNEAYVPKDMFNSFLDQIALYKIKKADPTIPISAIPYSNKEYINNLIMNPIYRDPSKLDEHGIVQNLFDLASIFKDRVQFDTKRVLSPYIEKSKNKRQINALKELLHKDLNKDINKLKYPNIQSLLKKSPQYFEDAKKYIKNAESKYSSIEEIEKEVITNLLLQRHKFIRGANLIKDNPNFIKKVFTAIPPKKYGGRADFPEDIVGKPGHIMDAMYTSNSMGTGLGYSYPGRRGAVNFPRIAIIGKDLEDLNLKGPVSTWWDKNKVFPDVPRTKDKVDFNTFYLHPAESTSGNTISPDMIQRLLKELPERYPGSEFLLDKALKRSWFNNTRTLKNFTIGQVDPFEHFLFIGPKGEDIPGYHILELIDPTKDWVKLEKGQKVTRMHEGKYSEGFSKGMRYGGFLK